MATKKVVKKASSVKKRASAVKPAATKKQANTKKRTAFSLDAPHAKHVSVVGDFNDWKPEKNPMKKDAKGIWKAILMIEPGTYEYKFLVDHDWWTDPAHDKTSVGPFGSHNSVIEVG